MDDKDKLIMAERLRNTIQSFSNNKNNDTFFELVKCLRESLVIVPIIVSMNDESTNQLPGNEQSLENIKSEILFIKKDNTMLLPIFTSIDQIDEKFRKRYSTLEYPFIELFKMLHSMNVVYGIVIDSFTHPFLLTERMLKVFESLI